MVEETEVIKEQIEQTRGKLTENLAELEGQIRDTVHHARSSVEEGIDRLKTSLRGLSPVQQAQERPLAVAAASMVAGVAVGSWLGGRKTYGGAPRMESLTHRAGTGLSHLRNEFDDEIRLVKGIVFSALIRGVGQVAMDAMPSYRDKIEEAMEKAISKVEADRPREEEAPRTPSRPTVVS